MNDDSAIGVAIVIVMLAVFVGIPFCCYQSAIIEAKVYNIKFNTNYTAKDFFFAGDSIKELYAEKIPERPATNNISATLELK